MMNKTKTDKRPIRGKALPLNVEPSWSSEKLLGAAIKKLKDSTMKSTMIWIWEMENTSCSILL